MRIPTRIWQQADLKIKIREGDYLDVLIYLQNGGNPSVHFQSTCWRGHSFFPRGISILDLTGNGYFSGLQGQGLGTMAVNVALQAFEERFFPETMVCGQMSTAGDPEDATLANECSERHSRFWKSFGFTVAPGQAGHESIRARLKDLKPKENGLALGEYPRFVNLKEFEASS